MKYNFTDKDIRIIRVISHIAGTFTMVVALTMIFSLLQQKIINPLDNPVLLSVKEQFDRDPANAVNAEQVRAMDLMARKAYFSSRWQVETGSYLLLAGAIIFILCQRIITDNEKINPEIPSDKPDALGKKLKKRKLLVISASLIMIAAVVASFVLRADLPDTVAKQGGSEAKTASRKIKAPDPDKTNWPFFRGQDSRGIAGGKGYPVEWDGESGKNIAWKIEIPGSGKSSPVIWNDRLFITGAQGAECTVYCIDKSSGKTMWTGSASNIEGQPAVLPKTDPEAGMAVSTVATNGNLVYAVFANGNLICFDMDGKQKWAKNIGVPETSYGYSSSLMIYENILLVQFDSNSKISLMGFDPESGEQKWETIRKGRPVWSSPVMAYFNGQPQLIINGNPAVSSYDPVTGKELWEVECMTGDVAPSVAVNSNMAFAVTDYASLVALNPESNPQIVWEDNTFTPDVSSPVATDDFLFLATGTGDVACYNAEKGDTLWTHYFMDQFYASPIIADGMVYLLDRSGVMHIIKEGSGFELIAESPLGENSDCTPAFSDKKIYIRGRRNLYCISKN